MKKLLIYLFIFTIMLSSCNSTENDKENNTATTINLSDEKITVNGNEITNQTSSAVYAANDIIFYLEGNDFTYGEGTKDDEHSQSEADAHTVVHITKPGKYLLSGKLSKGQIAVDLGDDAKDDENAVVTLVFNGVDITCNVAPAIIFYNVYECGNKNESKASKDVDTSKAGANVIIADSTVNNINGSYVAKIYDPESVILNDSKTEVKDADKLHKYDGAFYSKMSININGEKNNTGILNINAENEGLDSELHLTINGGIINIIAGNDGINTNEDNVSVTTINGGTLNILCDGSTGEGDGIDSNGWLIINGGTIISQACSTSGDAGIDSDKGIYINGGRVVATGNMLDRIAGGEQNFVVFNFKSRQSENGNYVLKSSNGGFSNNYATKNAFTYLIISSEDLTEGDYTLWQGETQLSGSKATALQGGMPNGERPENPIGRPGQTPDGEMPEPPNGQRPEPPNGQMPEPPNGERPEFPDGERPEMPEIPDGFNGFTDSKVSVTFKITKGGNYFNNVSPAN